MASDIPRHRTLGTLLNSNRGVQALEIALVALVAAVILALGRRVAGEGALAQQGVAWVANVAMLLTVWLGLRARGQGWAQLGLVAPGGGVRGALRLALQALVVLVATILAFLLGAVLMANLVGPASGPDMGGYNFLAGNLPALLASLLGVWIVSSFGEEVLYRGFLLRNLAAIGGGGRMAWRVAVVLGAMVFGLAHYAWGLAGMVQTAFMGLALGIAYQALGRKLWVLVVAHGIMDTVLLLQMFLAAPA
ncbi:CPBP family intramembrane metalloprotease [bacterium]|nr:CPBP family intramembrane metalloprotease [bacterium]